MLWLVFAIVCLTQYVENFNLQIPHDHISWRSLKIQSRSLKLYFTTRQSFPYNSPFESLVSSKPKQIFTKIAKIKEGKRTRYRDVHVTETG